VCPELGTLGGVEAALEERPEDGRVNRAPVHGHGSDDATHLIGGQDRDIRLVKETAVKIFDPIHAKIATG